MTKSLIYILLYACLNVSGAAFIKLQLQGQRLTDLGEWLKFIFNPYFFVAFALIILSALSLFKALSTNQFSLVVPIATGVNFILTIGIGYYLFEDKLSMISFLGFLLIMSGVVILSLNNQAHV
jgi:multidrug transporter EmrE-like cation transporter